MRQNGYFWSKGLRNKLHSTVVYLLFDNSCQIKDFDNCCQNLLTADGGLIPNHEDSCGCLTLETGRTAGPVFTNHSKGHSLSFSPRLANRNETQLLIG